VCCPLCGQFYHSEDGHNCPPVMIEPQRMANVAARRRAKPKYNAACPVCVARRALDAARARKYRAKVGRR
jgi:hypothetical protein